MNSNSQAAKKKSGKSYFRGVMTELKKVIWPTKDELFKFVVVVLVFCFLATTFIWVADFAFRNLIGQLIKMF